mmetsp:Transcript_24673/g.69228  ORF Transcript_24673/g.69228 Transcript_24673/m.69228 type:complete len:241 (-) Transcript_24673:1964-2686(-)
MGPGRNFCRPWVHVLVADGMHDHRHVPLLQESEGQHHHFHRMHLLDHRRNADVPLLATRQQAVALHRPDHHLRVWLPVHRTVQSRHIHKGSGQHPAVGKQARNDAGNSVHVRQRSWVRDPRLGGNVRSSPSPRSRSELRPARVDAAGTLRPDPVCSCPGRPLLFRPALQRAPIGKGRVVGRNRRGYASDGRQAPRRQELLCRCRATGVQQQDGDEPSGKRGGVRNGNSFVDDCVRAGATR